jgi:hypothetical protein
MDAQTSPVFRVDIIAPSPDVLICRWGKAFTAPPAAQAHTPVGCERFDRFLGGVLLKHQFAPHQALGTLAPCTSGERYEAIAPRSARFADRFAIASCHSSPIVVRS